MGSHREFAEVAALFFQGKLRAVIDRAFPLAEARAALEHLAAGAQFGKIVLEVEG
jgi:NADPH:quinone reductase-like Zn-dependent oxidoreductase